MKKKSKDRPKICRFITELREKQGLTKTKLAEIIKKTQPYITQIESGQRLPNFKLTEKLCKVLKCNEKETEIALYLTIKERNPEILSFLENFYGLK